MLRYRFLILEKGVRSIDLLGTKCKSSLDSDEASTHVNDDMKYVLLNELYSFEAPVE